MKQFSLYSLLKVVCATFCVVQPTSEAAASINSIFFISLFVMRVNTSSRASYHGVYYTSSSAQYAKVGQSQDVWQVRR